VNNLFFLEWRMDSNLTQAVSAGFSSRVYEILKSENQRLYVPVLIVFAVITRGSIYGNPVSHIDDQFYLLVGKSILRGQLPYIDIWDRKPIGLFLIYACIASLGLNSVVMVQLVATAFATATAYVISKIGNLLAPAPSGLLAALVYLAMLPSLSGGSGQSPIFYNFLMAIAGLITLRAVKASSRRGARTTLMLVGLAIAVKPVAMFEGIWFALVFLMIEWRRSTDLGRLIKMAVPMMGLALLPTALAFAAYAAIGHFGDIWSATVLSVLSKAPLPHRYMMALLAFMIFKLSVPLLFAATSLSYLKKTLRAETFFILGWLIAAVVGLAAVPNFFDHYALPLLVPLCAVMAPILSPLLIGTLRTAVLVLWAMLLTPRPLQYDGFKAAAKFDRVAALVKRNLKGGCLYVYEGPVQLYDATGACRVTRFVFPDHLNAVVETNALPVNQPAEIKHIFALRPAVVVEAHRIFLQENGMSRATLDRELACNYILAGAAPDAGTSFSQQLKIWRKRDVWRPCV
jgi:hypothetical protein